MRISYVQELTLADAVAVEHDARRLEAGVAVELDEQLADHVREVADDLLEKGRLYFVKLKEVFCAGMHGILCASSNAQAFT